MSEPTLKEWIAVAGRISGYVYNDERHPDGKVITTSDIIEMDKNGEWVLTKSGRYKLENNRMDRYGKTPR